MHYPFDVVPGFWAKLIELSNKNLIASIDKVKKELCDSSSDSLSIWCSSTLNSGFFADTSSCVDKYALVAQWTQAQPQLEQNAKNDFLSTDQADSWLIAYALKNNYTIVTHETSQPQRKKSIKIPEPCVHFGIRFTTTIEMFRELNETF